MDWLLPPDITADPPLREAIGGHPLIADILARRGITDVNAARAFLDPACYHPAPAADIPDLEIAASRLVDVINDGERILVWGDFDVDGQTSTALLTDALRNLGATVDYHVPHRLTHGHGVHVDGLMEHIHNGVKVVLTCDTGIAAFEAAEACAVNGVDMLITDHHALPPELPKVPAAVNPQRLPEGHPLRDLPGVGVSFMLVQALYELAGRSEESRQFLDLVALGIVSDVATQRLDTRYLLQLGIESLRVPKRTGLQALLATAQVDPSNMSSDLIGFQVGPRLNALGRLHDARLAVELLTTRNELHAQQIAAQLEVLNAQRKQIEDQIYGAAQAQIANDSSLVHNYEVIILAGDRWHAGVIGIVASRLVEQYGKPVVMLTLQEGKPARGSARSVPGVDIGASIAAQEDILLHHGGHPGAAGLALDPDYIPHLRRRLSNTVKETRNPKVVQGRNVDAELPLTEFVDPDNALALVADLNRLAPFGAGNPPITLMSRYVRLNSHAAFGVGNKHRKVIVEDAEGSKHQITWWRGAEHPLPGDVFDMLFIPRINDYKGRRSVQLEWVDSRSIPGVTIERGPRWRLIDLRADPQPLEALSTQFDDYTVWSEGIPADDIPFEAAKISTRHTPQTHPVLVIWTAPSGYQELTQMLALTAARTVVVLPGTAPTDTAEGFLKRLAGLVKYAMRAYDGEVTTLQLASATGQREFTVRVGLDWMAARGQIALEWLDGERVKITPGDGITPDADEPARRLDTLRALLAEAAAYRAYFRKANLEMFFEE